MKPTDCMLDIETMGRGASAGIIAIGAVMFDPYSQKTATSFEVLIDPVDAERTGGAMGVPTMMWWLQQDEPVRTKMFSGTTGMRTALRDFAKWYKEQGATRIWANGTMFDIVMMEDTFSRLKVSCPWGFRDVRDMRWFRDVVPLEKYADLYDTNIAHDARQDAVMQAQIVQRCYAYLGITK